MTLVKNSVPVTRCVFAIFERTIFVRIFSTLYFNDARDGPVDAVVPLRQNVKKKSSPEYSAHLLFNDTRDRPVGVVVPLRQDVLFGKFGRERDVVGHVQLLRQLPELIEI